MDNLDLKKIISHCKEYGFVFSSSEIYDGLSAVYDYGPNGIELKNNLKQYWWKTMVHDNDNIVGIDSSIFMHPKIWHASGHTEAFNDPLVDNKDSKKRYRVDTLIEEHIEKIRKKVNKDIDKAEKRFGPDFDRKKYITTNPRIINYENLINKINSKLSKSLEKNDLPSLKKIIDELEIKCPVSGTSNWTEVRQFNLMFSTKIGAISEDSNNLYLRPETAQGIFVNFLNVQKTSRKKIPFGIAQIGKAFRNEIVARQFIFRMREFEQMEMQFFVKPGDEIQWYNHWKNKRMEWHQKLNLKKSEYIFHDHLNLAHYANAACDIQFNFPMGFRELEGIHSRTDFDLIQHQKFSKKKLQYFDPKIDKSYVPFVVETSLGLDRLFLSIICGSLFEEKTDVDTRTVMKFPPFLAPFKVAILPLVKTDELIVNAKKIHKDLQKIFSCQYDEKDSIGKRYRRQDAIGTPYCITIDHNSIKDNMVTVRDRDTMSQDRIPIERICELIKSKLYT